MCPYWSDLRKTRDESFKKNSRYNVAATWFLASLAWFLVATILPSNVKLQPPYTPPVLDIVPLPQGRIRSILQGGQAAAPVHTTSVRYSVLAPGADTVYPTGGRGPAGPPGYWGSR